MEGEVRPGPCPVGKPAGHGLSRMGHARVTAAPVTLSTGEGTSPPVVLPLPGPRVCTGEQGRIPAEGQPTRTVRVINSRGVRDPQGQEEPRET